MKQPLEMIRGTTQPIKVELKTPNGERYALAEGEKLIFGLKHYPEDRECVLSKVLTAADADADGNYVMTLTPDDTIDLDFGCYYYDIGRQSGNAYYNVIPCSEFQITHNITAPEVSGD